MTAFFVAFSFLSVTGVRGDESFAAVDIDAVENRFVDYCFDCHGYGEAEGGFSFEKLAAGEYGEDSLTKWEAVWQNVRAETMPPADAYQPDPTDRREWIGWIQSDVFRLSPEQIDPGHVVLRRLNRVEYRNTVRELTGVDLKVNDLLPADNTGFGFDTIGEVLTLSPVVLERYIEAAGMIVDQVVPLSGPTSPRIEMPSWEWRLDRADGKRFDDALTFDKRRFLFATAETEHSGEYRFHFQFRLDDAWFKTPQTARVRVYQLPGSFDRSIGGEQLLDSAEPLGELVADFNNERDEFFDVELNLPAGKHHFLVDFEPTNGDRRLSRNEDETQTYRFRLNDTRLEGPLAETFLDYTDEQKRVLFNGPPPKDASAGTIFAHARKVIARFIDQAYRRPVESATIGRLADVVTEIATTPGKRYEDGIAEALRLILVSPRFLYRVEAAADPNAVGLAVPLDDASIASRLSYFLWASPPDRKLRELADQGQLLDQLEVQVDRMINDRSRFRRGVRNFVGQWLQTRDVMDATMNERRILRIRSTRKINEIFNWRVRRAMVNETETLFRHLVEENRPAEELLNADYSFLDRHLAKFYGIEDVAQFKGNETKKVDLPADSHRRGILTHGSVLLVTSNPSRTSPVKRGLFVLENLLGTPAPPAPPDVPELEEAAEGHGEKLSLREILELHRRDAACASCHNRMDPLGLAMENFNALGQFREFELPPRKEWWRDFREEREPVRIDGSGTLMTGESFDGVEQLADILATERRDDFYRCLTEKWLTYALGRGMTYRDATTIDNIVDELKRDDGRMRTLVKAIVRSIPFTHRRGTQVVAAP